MIDREYERTCRGKVPYVSEAEARIAARRVARRNGGQRWSVYRCQFCEAFHFGHKSRDRGRKRRLAAATRAA